jgi:hypothetical protein
LRRFQKYNLTLVTKGTEKLFQKKENCTAIFSGQTRKFGNHFLCAFCHQGKFKFLKSIHSKRRISAHGDAFFGKVI